MPEPIRRKRRQLTQFMCQELLYDYMTGRLDEDRRQAVENFLRDNPKLQYDLKAMAEGVRYCEQLGKTRLSNDLVRDLAHVKLPTEWLAEKVAYRNWPDVLKWSAEAAVISACVAGLALIVPWQSLQEIFDRPPAREIILADVDKRVGSVEESVPPVEAKSQAEEPAPVPTPIPTPITEPTPPAVTETTTIAAVKPPTESRVKPQPKGLLYRIMMNVPNIKDRASVLRDKIVEMGGKKAGQVEIGWRKSNGNYFHFSLPEKEYQNLLTTLGEYGPVRIYKNPHQRVMPPGQIRIILWIEDAPGAEASETSVNTESETEVTASPPATETPSTGTETEEEQ